MQNQSHIVQRWVKFDSNLNIHLQYFGESSDLQFRFLHTSTLYPLGDSIRLTGGTYGFLEIFGPDHGHEGEPNHGHDHSKYDHSKWFPACASTIGAERRKIGQVVCKSFNMTFERSYGTAVHPFLSSRRKSLPISPSHLAILSNMTVLNLTVAFSRIS